VSDVALRRACRDDADAIADLHAGSWRATYRGAMRDDYLDADVSAERRGVWRERLIAPAANQHVMVAVDGAVLAGFGCAYGADDERFGTQLDNLHVRRDRQGEGIGRDLIAAVAAWCTEHHPDVGLYLWVVEQNVGARRFYERLGAADAGGDVWRPPDGSTVPVRRCVWAPPRVVELAAGGRG
jgi:GNAT superfamily N-acetyltransferase